MDYLLNIYEGDDIKRIDEFEVLNLIINGLPSKQKRKAELEKLTIAF